MYNRGMKSWQNGSVYILRLDQGEDLIAKLRQFCEEKSLYAGLLWGLGAVRDVVLGYYDLEKKGYQKWEFQESLEICSLTGSISELKEKPFIHMHAVLGDHEGRTYGGHLFKATISIVGEFFILPFPKKVIRQEPFLDFYLLSGVEDAR